MDALLHDLKFAARQLYKDRGFLFTVVLTLALCIGANTTIFSVINAVILRPLPVPEPERLVNMWNAYPGAVAGGSQTRGANGVPDYYDRRELTDVFEEVAAFRNRGRSLEIEGTAQRVRAVQATPSYFGLLRAEAAIGRTFTEQESEQGSEHVVVLSHGLWQQLYGGDATVIGEDLRVDGEPYTIVGIMPGEFSLIDDRARLWTPLSFPPEERFSYHSNSYSMIARLAPGATLAQAQEQIDALNQRNMDRVPELKPLLIDAGFHTPLVMLQQDMVRDVRSILYMLWGGVACVLLIGCVNVANLVLVRSSARSRELATRFALGARRRRVVRQLLTEIVVLTLGGGAVGLLVGQGGLRLLGSIGMDQVPRAAEIRLDGAAIAFTLGLALAVGVVVSLIPLASVLRLDLSSVFRGQGRTGTAGRPVRLLRKGMVVAQVAFALVLLAGAGLLLASFSQLLAVNPGFEPQGVLTGTVVLSGSRYAEESALGAFADQALSRIRALPGVEAAGITSQIPFGSGFSDSVIFAEGYVMEPGESVISPSQNTVSTGYFDAMQIPVLEGRAFDARDVHDGRAVILIDQTLARRFFPQGGAVGKRMWRPTSTEHLLDPESAEYFDIVGVAATVRMRGLVEGLHNTGAYYFPLAQQARRGLDLAIKTDGDPHQFIGAVRGVIADLDPDLPWFDVRTMRERIDESLTDRRTPLVLAAGFSLVALLLAAVGIYGVLAYLVQLRTKEVGIRVALGSDAGRIFRLVLREGAVIVSVGLVLGVLGTMALGRFIESQLYEVSATDPTVLVAVASALAAVAMLACVVPAWRATRIDPVGALAQE